MGLLAKNQDLNQSVDRRPEMFGHIKQDLMASVVVFLVSLPLNMGIALASGVPLASGLISGIIGGIVVGLLAGSPLQVSGPAAGMAVLVFTQLREYGLELLFLIVLIAGLFQLVAGLLRTGQWFRAVSPAVVQGMLAGIGVLIFASQFHIMVDDSPRATGVENILSIPMAIYKGLVPLVGAGHHWAASIGVFTILTIVVWESKRPNSFRFLPGPLVAVFLATLLAVGLALPINHVDLGGGIFQSANVLSMEQLSRLGEVGLWTAGLAMAIVASAQTLLTSTAVDRMHQGPRTNYDRELVAQGVGNMLCGLLGGLIMAGVIVRSAANVNSGGKTRLATILHGVWLLVFVACFPGLLATIPTSCLAAVLVYTGYKLVNPKVIRELWAADKSEVAIYFGTMVGIVVFDMLVGVAIGVALALAKLLWRLSHLETQVLEQADANAVEVRLAHVASPLSAPKFLKQVEHIPAEAEVTVDVGRLRHAHPSFVNLLTDWVYERTAAGGQVSIDWELLHQKTRQHRPEPARVVVGAERQRRPEMARSR